MTEFQDRGESLRRHYGIDGTAGDAQDVPHLFHLDQATGACLICGLVMAHRKHAREGTPVTDRPKLTSDQAIEITDAIKRGDAIVCYAKCWPCQFGQCTDEPHTWMDDDDRDHVGISSSVSAADLAAQKPCGCHCMAAHRERLALIPREDTP